MKNLIVSPHPDEKKPMETRHRSYHHFKRGQGPAHAAAGEQGGVKRTAGTSGKVVGTGIGGVQGKGSGRRGVKMAAERPLKSAKGGGYGGVGSDGALAEGEKQAHVDGGQISPLQALFDSHDWDKSGFIDRMELSQGLRKVRSARVRE